MTGNRCAVKRNSGRCPPIAALWVLCAAAAAGPSAVAGGRDAIRKGNEEFKAGRYAEALAAYRQAEPPADAPPDADLLHNQAATHFKLGQIAEARDLWVRAATLKDARFEADARYNLGNCSYAEALAALDAAQHAATDPDGPVQSSPQAAMSLLDKAAEHYRDAIRLNAEHTNARANLELALNLKREIEKRSTTQPQSQSQPASNGESQPSSQPSSPQPQSSQPSSDASDQQDPTSQPTSGERPESQPRSQPRPRPEEQPETQPSEENPNPEEATSQPFAESQPEQFEELPINPVYMTKEEAEKLLQKVRDAERARRIELMRREAARYRPVDRDW